MTENTYSLVTVSFALLGKICLPIVACNGEIALFAGAYALHRYELGRKLNSIKSDQVAILNLYRFCHSQKIDVQHRVAEQTPLTIGEIEAFAAYWATRANIAEC